MKKVVTIILMMVIIMALMACGRDSITIESSSGFSHEVSVRIPFNPMEDAAVSLYIDNDGRAVFVKPNENHLGKVNAEREYCPELIVVDKDGVMDRLQPGIFNAWGESREGGFFTGVGGKYSVQYLNKANLATTEVMDNSLNTILQRFGADCFGDKVVCYSVPLTSNPGIERFTGIYDIQTGNEVLIDLEEDYANFHGIDFNDDSVLVKAVKTGNEPPDLYIIGLDGSLKLKLTLGWSQITQYSNACFTQEGVLVYVGRKTIASSLDKYSCNGTLEWSNVIPITGTPELKRVQTGNDELISLTVRSGDTDRYIGCFNTDNDSQLFAATFHDNRIILPLDIPAVYYLHPQWSLYPEISPPAGRISLYNRDEEIAFADITDGIYYFAASPNGNFFAVR